LLVALFKLRSNSLIFHSKIGDLLEIKVRLLVQLANLLL